MFDLFRYVMLRPAVTREPYEIVSTVAGSDFQRQLEQDRDRPSPAAAMEQTANQFLKSDLKVASGESLALGKAYDALATALRAVVPADRAALLPVINNGFGAGAADVVARQDFRDDRKRLADTLIAVKLGTPRSDIPVERIARDLRLIALVQRAADKDTHLDVPGAIAAALDASIALPAGLLPVEFGAPPAEGRDRPADDHGQRKEAALREYRELSDAHEYLRDLPPDHLVDAASHGAEPAPHAREASDPLVRELHSLREAVVSYVRVAGAGAVGGFATAASVVQGAAPRVRREALLQAPQGVHAGLRAARVDLAESSLQDAVDRIDARRRELAPLLLEELTGASSAGGSAVSLVGGQFIPTSDVPDLILREERDDHA